MASEETPLEIEVFPSPGINLRRQWVGKIFSRIGSSTRYLSQNGVACTLSFI
jgi:hypothetical protein